MEKFIGDAVMALWGAPTAYEDDAERAVRAALDLVEMVPVLGRELEVDLQLRAGVLTGEAAVAVGAESEGMVTGDMVNTASRLQSAAAPGTVLVGEATRLAAGEAIAFESAGDQVRRKLEPVPTWRAMRVVAERGGARRPDAIEPPFVGRADERRYLKEQFHATGREGRARLVSLVGQAGIGKSRLAWDCSFRYRSSGARPRTAARWRPVAARHRARRQSGRAPALPFSTWSPAKLERDRLAGGEPRGLADEDRPGGRRGLAAATQY